MSLCVLPVASSQWRVSPTFFLPTGLLPSVPFSLLTLFCISFFLPIAFSSSFLLPYNFNLSWFYFHGPNTTFFFMVWFFYGLSLCGLSALSPLPQAFPFSGQIPGSKNPISSGTSVVGKSVGFGFWLVLVWGDHRRSRSSRRILLHEVWNGPLLPAGSRGPSLVIQKRTSLGRPVLHELW